MPAWQKFLDSLSTKGGNLFVLLVCFAGLLCLLMHVLHHGDSGNVSMVVVATFSGFSGALMATLTGKDSKEQSEHVPGNATRVIVSGSKTPGDDAVPIAIPDVDSSTSAGNAPKTEAPTS
jgi:hypothetical protein